MAGTFRNLALTLVMKILQTSLFLPALFALGALAADGRTVTVAGSDYLPGSLVEALGEFAAERDDKLEIELNGSLLAFRDFEEGDADLILVALPYRGPEDFEFPVIPIGYQVGTIVVNRANPITSLSVRQLGGLFGSTSENAISRWANLGLSGPWRERNIQIGYVDSPDSPAVELFSARFLDNDPIRPGIQAFSSTVRLESFVANNDAAIGLLDALPLSGDLKTIQIEAGDGGVSFGPTLENVNFGDYPFSLGYYVCVPVSQHRFLTPYLEFLLSDEVAGLLQEEGFFPLLKSRRGQLINELPRG